MTPRDGCKREAVLEQISATEAMITTLQKKRIELNEALNSTTPIMTILTLDVLTEIFCIANEDQSFSDEKYDRLPMPFFLSGICKMWRKVVLSTPRLWSIIAIRHDSRHDFWYSKLDLWLSRSGNSPLRLDLQVKSHPPGKTMALLLKETSRWRTLSSNELFVGSIQDIKHNGFPMLRSLAFSSQLQHYKKATAHQILMPISTFAFVHFTEFELHRLSPKIFRFNLNSVKRLCATLDFEDCMFIFRRAKSLQFCDLTYTPFTPPKLPDTPCFLPQLSKIQIKVKELTSNGYSLPVQLREIFQSISVPALQQLVLEVGILNPGCMEHLNEMIKRSSCHLVRLELLKTNVKFPVDLIRILPSLQWFIVTGCPGLPNPLSDTVMDALNPSLARGCGWTEDECLPSLILFYFRGAIIFKPQAMIDMLKSRMDSSQVRRDPNAAQPWPFQKLGLMKIEYTNVRWGTGLNPNVLRDFYRDITTLSISGLSIDFDYVTELGYC